MIVKEISVGQLLNRYLHHIENSEKRPSVGPTKSAFVRIVVPILGGKEPRGKRATGTEIHESFQFLDGVSASTIHSLLDEVDAWFSRKGIASQQGRSDRSRISTFVEWVIQESSISLLSDALNLEGEQTQLEQESLKLEVAQPQEQVLAPVNIGERSRNGRSNLHRFRPLNRRFKSANGTRRTYAKDLRMRGKSRVKAFSLGCQQFDDYVVENGKRVLGNSQLQTDFEELEVYQQQKLKMRPASIKKNADHLRSFYGWLHRHKGLPLAALSFRQQIPVFPLYYRLENCLDENGLPNFQVRVFKEAIDKDKAKEAAASFIELFEEFLDFMDGAASSDCAYLGAILNVAKFVYHKVTDRDDYDDFQDISVIRKLRVLRRERDVEEEPVVPHDKKSLPWPKILEVLEQLRAEADTVYLEGCWGPNKEKFYSNRRKDLWIAKSHLKFLIVALLCIIPPHRSRTIQELEIGVTMLQGAMIDGEFVAAEFLVDTSDVTWWLYLPPDKIKTGKKFGPYWSELPNVQFADGKYFYEYVDRWLNNYRKCFPTTHNRFFTRHSGSPITAQTLWEYHRDFFMRIAEVPVTPKELRSSFVTYLYDIGVPDFELDAVAFSMHHSKRMQESHYRKQKQLKRTRIAVSLSTKLVETIIGIRSNLDELA